jgi:hypothetical protein
MPVYPGARRFVVILRNGAKSPDHPEIRGHNGRVHAGSGKVLPSRLEYAAFVLYMYEEPDIRLAPFAWLCPDGLPMQALKTNLARLNGLRTKSVEDIAGRVAATVLPSTAIIHGLSKGSRGTSDDRIIREHICPDLIPNVQIEITWREVSLRKAVQSSPAAKHGRFLRRN